MGGQPQLAAKAPVGLWLARGFQPVGMSTGDAVAPAVSRQGVFR